MTLKLTKGIYSQQFDATKTPFGLLNDQRRHDSIINSGVWFNANGERLGFGDLSLKDMARIQSHIGSDVFLVLSEGDACWDMPDHIDRNTPGFEYVSGRMLWSIANTGIIRIRDYVSPSEMGEVTRDGVKYTRTSREAMAKALGSKKVKVATSNALDQKIDEAKAKASAPKGSVGLYQSGYIGKYIGAKSPWGSP